MRYGASGIRHQEFQRVEFMWCQMDPHSCFLHLMPNWVQDDIPDMNGQFRWDLRSVVATDRGTQPCYQFSDLEWLGDVIVRAGFKSLHLIVLAASHSKDQDREAREN